MLSKQTIMATQNSNPNKVYVERVLWETVRQDCKYPESDNNEGLIYGLNFTDFEGEGDIYEVEWFATDELRQAEIDRLNAIVIFD